MEIITAKEAHEKSLSTIPIQIKSVVPFIFKDIQIEIDKGNFCINYYRKDIDAWFFNKMMTSTTREFFERLGYCYAYNYGLNSCDDCITISW